MKRYGNTQRNRRAWKKPLLIMVIPPLLLTGSFYLRQQTHARQQLQGSKQQVTAHQTKAIELRTGDIIFQTSRSAQSQAIQLATHSRYSHCGLIQKEGNRYFVLEAIQPVKRTPLEEWIARGADAKFVVKRLKNADQVLTPAALQKMEHLGKVLTGKDYDPAFEWSDDRMYCSELIWKLYYRTTGTEIGRLQRLRDFDLGSAVVKAKMKERYGNNIPMDDTVIAPSAIFESGLLTIVTAR